MNSKSAHPLSSRSFSAAQARAAALPAHEFKRRAACFRLIVALLLVAWCAPAHADNPPSWYGLGLPREKPDGTVSFIKTSDNKLLGDGVNNITTADGEVNYPGQLSSFPGPVIDVVMQQCFGGGFAKGMQQFLNQYTFTAATNWNELAWNTEVPPAVNNFTNSWVQSLPRGGGMLQHYMDATDGAAADGPKPAVAADPFGPSGAKREPLIRKIEYPSFASPDATPDNFPNPNGPNNTREFNSNNQWAILMATQPDQPRFSTNIKRVYDALRNLPTPVPANHIVVLFGNSAANTTTADGTPINGPITVKNFYSATAGGDAAGNLFGSITGLEDMGIPNQVAAKPNNQSRLFVYNTGHGGSFTKNGAQRVATPEVNKGKVRVVARPANDFTDAGGTAAADGDTTSFIDLQISTFAPLNPGVIVTVNGTLVGSLQDDNSSPESDLTPFIGATFNYNVPVSLSYLNSFDAGAPIDIDFDNVLSLSDSLFAAVTFNDYGDSWSVSLVPEPTTAALLITGLAIASVFRRRNSFRSKNSRY